MNSRFKPSVNGKARDKDHRAAPSESAFMVQRVTHFSECKIIEDMVAVVVKNPEIVLLLEVSHNDAEMLTVPFFNNGFPDFIGDKLFDAF